MTAPRGYSDEVDTYLALRAALCPDHQPCDKCHREVLNPRVPCRNCGHINKEDGE